MTTLVDEILTELSASWSLGSVPNFANMKDEASDIGDNSVLVKVLPSKENSADLVRSAHYDDRVFEISVNALDESTRDDYVAEIKSIIRSFNVTNGWWDITSNYNVDLPHLSKAKLIGTQNKIVI